MKRFAGLAVALTAIAAFLVLWAGSASAIIDPPFAGDEDTTPVSGAYDMKDQSGTTNVTECPQAGLRGSSSNPLDKRSKDDTEKKSEGGSNIRVNQDYSCFPQDETSLDRNPTASKNIVGGANDYRMGWGTSGFYASTDNGNHWYDGITPFPSLPSGDNLDGGGDPAVVFDRDGVVYYAQINFNRTDGTSGVWVNRSTNGGYTWTRPCVAIRLAAPPSEAAACGGAGDVRQPGDGTVAVCTLGNACPVAYDKEWITAGPRINATTGDPIPPVCFTPLSHNATTCDPAVVGSDRLYVTYSSFTASTSAQILEHYSDDQGRSWSPSHVVTGGASFCAAGGRPGNGCDDNQGSQPTVNPTTGQLWVGYINGDTTDEDQYLVSTSKDGGNTFGPPMRVDTLYDVNEPRAVNGRTDCTARGQGSTRAVPTNSCFRFDPIMNSIVADKRGGAFADDLYVATVDNRNGTIRDSNNDVFFFKSTDGGATWIGPTRVNNDRSETPTNRDCGRNTNSIVGNSAGCAEHNWGADQFFPWITIDPKGNLNVTFHDRRLDSDSPIGSGAWPTSKTEVGNYLIWYWGGSCKITQTVLVSQTTTGPVPNGAKQCVAPEAVVNPTVVTGFNPGAGPIPGNGQDSSTLPFRNFQISDVGSNWDYSFRAGIFAGDYSGNSSGPIVGGGSKGDEGDNGGQAAAFWTDARNGRGSGAPTSLQPGRNPICEQSDVFFDRYALPGEGNGNGGGNGHADPSFLVAPCPTGIQDHGNHGD